MATISSIKFKSHNNIIIKTTNHQQQQQQKTQQQWNKEYKMFLPSSCLPKSIIKVKAFR